MKKFYAIANSIVVLAVIFWNYWVNSRAINGNTVGSLSDEYANLFTPAGYAFSIWALIFIGLIALCIFQVKKVFIDRTDDDFVLKMGPFLIIANIGNALWLWFWLQEQTAITIPIMLCILIALLTCVLRLNLRRDNSAPAPLRLWVWTPIALYSGWITVATIANISAYLAKINWQFLFSESTWAMIMIIIAAALNLLLIRLRNMTVFAGVGAWAILAIAVRHWDTLPLLQWTALASALLLVLAILKNTFSPTSTSRS